MRHILHIALVLSLIALGGCRKDEQGLDGGYIASNDLIDFSDNTLTKNGTVLTDDDLDEIEVYAYYTPSSNWGNPDSVSEFMVAQKVTKDDDDVWSYSPARYWPASTDDHITFFAFSPCGLISASTDESTSKPIFSYTIPALAVDGYDLVGAVARDENKESGEVNFNLDHLLTKILIYAQITQEESGSYYEVETDDKFVVNGVIINAYSEGTLNYEYDDSEEVWVQSWTPSTSAEITATQSNVLLSKDDSNAILEVGADSAISVMEEGEAIFVMPQDLKVSKPTIQLRVRRSYTESSETKEVVYETNAVTIPTTTISEWEMGAEVAINLSVDIDDLLGSNTPLTVTSEVFWYSDTTVEVDMHSNLYIYSSLSDITATVEGDNMYGEFMICTNYDYNLRVPHHRVELDGEITSSRGFVFCSDDFNGTDILSESYTVGDLGYEDYEIFLPTLLDTDKNEIVYVTKDNLQDNLLSTTVGDVVSYSVNGTPVYFDNHDFAYYLTSAGDEYDFDDDTYAMLYYAAADGAITEFDYDEDGEINLTDFEVPDNEGRGTVNFKIKIGEVDGIPYEFDFSVTKSTREIENLYTSTAIGEDSSYGVNKAEDDPVYTLRLSVNEAHLDLADGVLDGEYGEFDDIIGVKMISNGGGVITQLFSVTLSAPESEE